MCAILQIKRIKKNQLEKIKRIGGNKAENQVDSSNALNVNNNAKIINYNNNKNSDVHNNRYRARKWRKIDINEWWILRIINRNNKNKKVFLPPRKTSSADFCEKKSGKKSGKKSEEKI